MNPVNEWLALMRVHQGGVTVLGGHFVQHGRPVPEYLVDALVELLRTEQLALVWTDPTGQQHVCVTHAGQARYAELNGNRMPERRHDR
ncbi:MAG: hypothetical protein ACRDRV_05810 [Pseudonocardiaceae bacterium]